jgi:hypothetical protein
VKPLLSLLQLYNALHTCTYGVDAFLQMSVMLLISDKLSVVGVLIGVPAMHSSGRAIQLTYIHQLVSSGQRAYRQPSGSVSTGREVLINVCARCIAWPAVNALTQ